MREINNSSLCPKQIGSILNSTSIIIGIWGANAYSLNGIYANTLNNPSNIFAQIFNKEFCIILLILTGRVRSISHHLLSNYIAHSVNKTNLGRLSANIHSYNVILCHNLIYLNIISLQITYSLCAGLEPTSAKKSIYANPAIISQ